MRPHDGAPPEKLPGARISPEGSKQHLGRLSIGLKRLADTEEKIRRVMAEDSTIGAQETLPGEHND